MKTDCNKNADSFKLMIGSKLKENICVFKS